MVMYFLAVVFSNFSLHYLIRLANKEAMFLWTFVCVCAPFTFFLHALLFPNPRLTFSLWLIM